ncbi:putative lipase transmembrane protein [Beutenbergia cavernae DSM 12333]|uniref:Putative lipase transmembrane protein n=1 Tax=Beutenbergia cavernae (strain ATCC BAA-8 / DSM 12333 / CCUG 43141 / JCM 11478 / NBRC 16432 / NCIMB 13614 / HKI 0122) TaxID=471853 RepID=C5C0M2_BEUC1|nr:hypothetical protein [Beutenbergia cavernae]ACQ81418.1 putative lipase transmembrane protein [Beutenbergia cavernae DSM 12333]
MELRLGVRAADYAYVVARQLESARHGGDAVLRLAHVSAPSGAAVVLLPGVYETWHVMAPLAWALHDAGHPVHVVPSLGRSGAPIEALAPLAAAALARADLRDVVLVAHSKGGLVGKSLMVAEAAGAAADRGQEAAAAAQVARPASDVPVPRIRGLVTVATPWAGSRYAPWIPMRAVRALGPRAAALVALGAEVHVDSRIVAVRPSWDPHIPDPHPPAAARDVVVDATGHFRILADPDVHAAVLDGVASLSR